MKWYYHLMKDAIRGGMNVCLDVCKFLSGTDSNNDVYGVGPLQQSRD